MSNLGVKEMLALLDALKSAVRDCAAREEKLNGEFRAQSAAATRLSDEAVVKRTEKLAGAVDRENAEFAERTNRWQANYENRKARINQAHAAVRKRVMDEIGEHHGQLKYKIQASTLEAEHRRDDALAQTVVTLENFRQAAAQGVGALDELAKSARRALGGCGKFRRLLSPNQHWPEPDLSPDENKSFEQQQKLQEKIRSDLAQFKRFPLPQFFRFFPVWLVTLIMLAGVAVLVMAHLQMKMIVPEPVAGAVAGLMLVLLAVYFFGTGGAAPLAKTIAGDLAKARRLLDAAAEKAELRYQQDQARFRADFDNTIRELNQEWRQAVRGAMELRGAKPVSSDEQAGRAARKCDQLHRARLKQLEKDHADNLIRLREESETDARKFSESLAAKTAKFDADFQAQWQSLENEWKNSIQSLYGRINAANADSENLFPEWNSEVWKNWTPPREFKNAAQFGRLEVDLGKFAETLPKDKRLAFP